MRISRADRSRLGLWWFTIDRAMLVAILTLIGIGLVVSLVASPAVAVTKGLPTYYFVERHALFSALGALIVVVVSFFSPRGVRRLAAIMLAACLVGLVWVLVFGETINGARRWIHFFGYSLQPSEFVKPALIVIIAWLFGESVRRSDMPALPIAAVLGALVVGLLVAQPDVGQTFLVGLIWIVLFALSGQKLARVGALVAGFVAVMVFSYLAFDHVRQRVDGFLGSRPADNSQLERAMESFTKGGFFGRGPGEGTIKSHFPDAHNDFIFAVVAEEYGIIACLVLIALFAFIVLRALLRAAHEPDAANQLAMQGLAIAFGLQALINMSVNAGLLPAKGMTLPYLSAGGSSMLAISVTSGMLLALMRRRPDLGQDGGL